jgi:hypothetical protein
VVQQRADWLERADEDHADTQVGEAACAGDRDLGRATGYIAEVVNDHDPPRPIHIGS